MLKYALKKQLDETIRDKEFFNIFHYARTKARALFWDDVIFDTAASTYLKYYLYNHCIFYVAPTYLTHVKTFYKSVNYIGNYKEVFYPIKEEGYYFRYKNCIFTNTMERSRDRVRLKFIRGTLDIKSLVNDAYSYHSSLHPVVKDVEPYYYNYYVKEHFGTADLVSNFNFNIKSSENKTAANTPNDSPSLEESSDSSIYDGDIPINHPKSSILTSQTISRTDPLVNYYFPEKITNYIKEISQWLQNEDWFVERELPYKRGILLHGPAGTGKSSFAKVLGLKFGIPIHQFHLSNMTDKDFKDAWTNAIQDTRTIILFEDFDNIYHKRTPVNTKTKLNFDTILNTISGIQDMAGVILIITTNDITKIDEAIGVSTDDGISTRPGRIDSVIYLGKMEDTEKEKLICKILKDWPDLIAIAMNSTTNYTAAQVQEHCIKVALEKLNENVTVIK